MHPRASLPARLLAPALTLAVSVALVGCSGGDESPEAEPEPTLATPSGSGEVVPLPVGETAPIELETYRVCLPIDALPTDVLVREEFLEPSEDVTIDSVDAVGADGFELVDSWVAAADQDPGGFFDTVPPGGDGVDDAYGWDDREPAAGAQLISGQGYHLFVHLRRGASGEIGGVQIGYTSGGESFDVATTNKYVAGQGC